MDEKAHVYYNNRNEIIPSVTQVLKALSSKGIAEWANWLGWKRISYTKHLDELSFYGTIVHDWINKTFNGEEIKELGMRVPNEDKIYTCFSRFNQWKDETQAECLYTEKAYNNNRYSGTIDLIAKIKNGMVGLIDFKTSASPRPSHVLQLGGYLNLIEETDNKLFNQITYAQIISLGGDSISFFTLPREKMRIYQQAFEKLFLLYCSWKDILKNDWNETIV